MARLFRLVVRTPPVAAAALLLFACTAGLSTRSDVQHTIGRATFHDIVAEVPDILRRSGYSIHDRRRTGRTVSFVTAWRNRVPFEDEAEQGVDAARTRITLFARESGHDRYTLRIRAENEVQGAPGAFAEAGVGWSAMPATQMYEDYVRELSTQIRLQVDAGVRVH